jgi:hypothetical protein
VAGLERGRARCSCGDVQPPHDLIGSRFRQERRQLTSAQAAAIRADAQAWRDDHLRTTWPILVQRVDGETPDSHARRVKAQLSVARALRERLIDEADRHQAPISLISEEQIEVGVRAAVLKNQYNELCEYLRTHAIESDEAAHWRVEGHGDPLDEI